MKKLFYVETGAGCGIRVGKTIKEVRQEELKEAGTYNGVSEVRKATEADIAWVKTMGGYIPEI